MLSCYVEDNILGKEQSGYRVGYSTIDHILIIELYQSVKNVYIVHLLTTVKPLISLIETPPRAELLSYEINGKLLW